jgi:glycyl-tRNA synthetase
MEDKLKKLASLCKRRGFVYQTTEIYGGLAGFYDYGPMGAELMRNLKNLWWEDMVRQRDNVYGIDGSIILHPKVWEASGHVEGFDDPLIECEECHKRVRVDKLEGWRAAKNDQGEWEILEQGSLDCPDCDGKLIPEIKQFNLMMETYLGTVSGEKTKAYLKGESCQNTYLNFKPIVDTLSPKIPFAIAQIGKAFRNEITFGKFIFKLREFEQWDVEYFVHPDNADEAYQQWKEIRWNWYVEQLGINEENLRWRQHTKDELIFYARDAWDIEYNYPFGWDELEGLHDRSDYDLKQHSEYSGEDLRYIEPDGTKYYPFVIEASGGVDRTFLAVLLDALKEDDKRTWLSLDPKIAPYKAAVFPLLSNKEELVEKARGVYEQLKQDLMVAWDDSGNIGKRYRRQDEIATPWCVTIDFDTLEDDTVTVRDRDTMEQERININNLNKYFQEKLEN